MPANEPTYLLPLATRIAMDRDRYRAVLEQIRDEYCADRADADCVGDPPRTVPNAWLQVFDLIEEVLRP